MFNFAIYKPQGNKKKGFGEIACEPTPERFHHWS
jgi:hypothetical protein